MLCMNRSSQTLHALTSCEPSRLRPHFMVESHTKISSDNWPLARLYVQSGEGAVNLACMCAGTEYNDLRYLWVDETHAEKARQWSLPSYRTFTTLQKTETEENWYSWGCQLILAEKKVLRWFFFFCSHYLSELRSVNLDSPLLPVKMGSAWE